MEEAVSGRPSDLVFNLDEIEIFEWEDSTSSEVTVPVVLSGQTVHHGISRNLKHITIITCAFPGEACLVPYMVILQAIKPAWLPLEKTGIQVGRDLILKHRATYDAYLSGA
jgi:hypothetical protein